MIWFAPVVTIVCAILSYLLWAASRLERVVAELFSEREHSRVTLNSIGDGVISVDVSGCVDFINIAAIKMIANPLASAQGLAVNTVFNFTETKHDLAFNTALKECLDCSEAVRISEGLTIQTSERTLIVMVTFAPLFNTDGGIMGVVIGFTDVTDNIKTSQQLAFQATHDALTKLPNRSLLSDRLELAIKRAQRSNHIIAVLFIDLDRFKNINDALGHANGDELLKAVAERFQSAARQGDTVARLGGDEFVILLEGVTEMNAIASVAYKILALAETPYNIEGHELFVGCSIGVSTFPKDGLSASILLKYADVAMYQAKAYGRNGVQFYSHEMNYRTLERLEIEKDLRYALQNEEFELYYQPQIDANNDLIVGVEALLRWRKNGEIVSAPDEFIPIAEDSGFIHMLGEWVLYTACQQFVSWLEMGLPTLSIAVNVSPRQLFNREFVNTLTDALRSTGMPPECLDIEITEQTIMSDMARAAELLNEIRSIGCTVSIDDFGTGYSSLSYLKKLPVNTLKIDQSFVQDIVDNSEDKAITEAIVTMGHGLGMQVIAEGVETRPQMDVLAAQACDVFQGYYFSIPLSGVEMTEYLRACDANGGLYWRVVD